MATEAQMRLYIELVEAGRMEEAENLRRATESPSAQRTLSPKEDLLVRGRDVGLEASDLFVPEEPWENKFVADAGALFKGQGIGARQLLTRLTAGDTQNVDAEALLARREYEESGLADEFTGGQLAGGLLEGGGGSFLLRNLLKQSPKLYSSLIGGGEMLAEPVTGDNYAADKAKQVGAGLTLGAAGEAIPQAGVRALEGVINAPSAGYRQLMEPSANPRGTIARGSAEEQQIIGEIAEEGGFNLTPGQRSQSPAIKQAEELARTNIFTRNRVADLDDANIDTLDTYIQRYRDSLGENAPINVVASKLQAFGRETAEKLKDVRRAQADEDYGAIRMYADGQPVIPGGAYVNELVSIVRDGMSATAKPEVRAAAREAENLLGRLKQQEGMLSGRDVENITRAEGFVAGDNPFTKTTYDTQVANRLRSAVEDDIAGYPGISEQLKTAKSNYRTNSGKIDAFEADILGQIIGKEFASDLDGVVKGTVSPEKVMAKFTAPTTSPTDVEISMRHLDEKAPELAQQLRASIVERARVASMARPAAAGLGGDQIDPGAFLRALGITSGERGLKNLEKLEALFPDNPEFRDRVITAARLLADKSFMNTSRTETQGAARDAINAASKLITGGFRGLVNLAASTGPVFGIARSMESGVTPKPVDLASARRVISGMRPATAATAPVLAREENRE